MQEMRLKHSLVALLFLTLAGCAETPHECVVHTLGTLPVLNDHGSPIVEVTLNDKKAAMIVDTGADFSSVSESLTKQYDMTRLSAYVPVNGVGGLVDASVYKVDKLGLGTGTTQDIALVGLPRTHGQINGIPIVGLFGGDFLTSYDVVFDLPAHKIDLYQLHGCPSPTPMWDGPVSKLRSSREGKTHIGLKLVLNNYKIDAILDSGSSATVVLPRQAHHAGVSEEQLATDISTKSRGIDLHSLSGHLHRFERLQIGDEVFPNPLLDVSPLKTDGDALLGADFLRHNRVWISNRNDMIYIQRLSPPPMQDPTFEHGLRKRQLTQPDMQKQPTP